MMRDGRDPVGREAGFFGEGDEMENLLVGPHDGGSRTGCRGHWSAFAGLEA